MKTASSSTSWGPKVSESRQFHLLRRLGQGAHGAVFLAEQISPGGFRRRVVLKTVLPGGLGADTESARRMRDEARILGRLSHRNTVSVTDLVHLTDRWAVVMDYVPGVDLRRVLERHGPLPVPAAVSVAAGVLAGLDAAWRGDNGTGTPLALVHRDIKPSNLLLTEDGDVKVLDFGVARGAIADREARTGALVLGTERYMAPECLIGAPASHASDVFSVTSTLVELLLGEPLGRSEGTPEEHLARIEAAVARVASRVSDPTLADALSAALVAGLEHDPSNRPDAASLGAVLRDLARVLGGESLEAFAARVAPVLVREGLDQSDAASGTLVEVPSGGVPAAEWLSDPTDVSRPRSRQRARMQAMAVVLALCLVAYSVAIVLVARSAWQVEPGASASSLDLAPIARTEAAPRAAPPSASLEPAAAPAPEPLVEAPAEEVAPTAAPVAPPTPKRRTKRQAPVPAAPAPPEESPAKAAAAERVPAALFVLPEASALDVRCGDVQRGGTTSVRLRNPPAGPCDVRATVLGEPFTARFSLERRAEVRCAVDAGRMTCR